MGRNEPKHSLFPSLLTSTCWLVFGGWMLEACAQGILVHVGITTAAVQTIKLSFICEELIADWISTWKVVNFSFNVLFCSASEHGTAPEQLLTLPGQISSLSNRQAHSHLQGNVDFPIPLSCMRLKGAGTQSPWGRHSALCWPVVLPTWTNWRPWLWDELQVFLIIIIIFFKNGYFGGWLVLQVCFCHDHSFNALNCF